MNAPADILTVHGLFVEPDDDNPDTIVVKDAEAQAIASIYVDNVAETVIATMAGGPPVAMGDLDQAYTWIVANRVEAEKRKVVEE